MPEIWKPCPGYEGLYSVSAAGRVRRDVSRTRTKAGYNMKLTISRDGYATVGLSAPGRRERTLRVHRLVYEAHRGSIPKGCVINHLDGNKLNNNIENLECVTNAENIRHAFRELGRRRTGEKLNEKIVLEMRQRRADGESFRVIAIDYDVTIPTVASVCKGRTWRHVGGSITPNRDMASTPQEVMARISDEDVHSAVARYRAGEGVAALSRELGVTRRTIYNWIEGSTRQQN